jgi:hypothetical protein
MSYSQNMYLINASILAFYSNMTKMKFDIENKFYFWLPFTTDKTIENSFCFQQHFLLQMCALTITITIFSILSFYFEKKTII